jgi:nuclear-control-of-ATPase protein 2
VDLELAMTALDKLLHANELNFAFLTAAPVLLITYGIVRWLRAIWQRRRGLSVGTARHEARIWLRRTERLLNRHLIPTSDTAVHGGLAYQPHGLLLCNTHALRNLLPHLGLSEELRREWLIDLREVEESRWTTVQRLNTIHRMYRTYGFLLSN